MKRLKRMPHLTTDELARQYRQATDPVARRQWQIVWLLAQGQPTATVVPSTGYSTTWIYVIVRHYNQAGAAGIGERRHANPGGNPLLSPALAAELDAALDQPPPDGGIWTSKKVAAWMSAKLGRSVHVPLGWEALQRLGWRPKVPRPRHVQADAEAQATFQQNFT
jgi:transposase